MLIIRHMMASIIESRGTVPIPWSFIHRNGIIITFNHSLPKCDIQMNIEIGDDNNCCEWEDLQFDVQSDTLDIIWMYGGLK